MINLMFICSDPEMAKYAEECGVNRIFVDLEIHGKQERQGHRDTVISQHSIDDVAKIREVIRKSELLVRINPVYEGSKEEVNQAIENGADIIMLPMFSTLEDIETIISYINGRCKFIPLVETPQAFDIFEEIIKLPGVDEVYIGLNDLHMALNMNFMFEPVCNGMIEKVASLAKRYKKPFGFGGIARMGEGLLPGEMVLAEHQRLGSTSVILSRTFHRSSSTLRELYSNIDFKGELSKLRDFEKELSTRRIDEVEADHQHMCETVDAISKSMNKR